MQARRRPPTTAKTRENVPPVVTLHASASCKDFYASDAERRLVQQATATHRDTTAAAERALKVSKLGSDGSLTQLRSWAGPGERPQWAGSECRPAGAGA